MSLRKTKKNENAEVTQSMQFSIWILSYVHILKGFDFYMCTQMLSLYLPISIQCCSEALI